MKAAVVLNPRAGGGSAESRWPRVRKELESILGTVELRTTAAPGDAVTLARELAAADYDLIVAAGGDGTVNETANGILTSGRDACLAVLPLASGGDFARGAGLRTTAASLAVLRAGKWRRIDVVRARYSTHSGETERYFVNVASLGLGGQVAEAVARGNRKLPGTLQYLLAAVPRLAAGHRFGIELTVDGANAGAFDITLTAVANSRYQGGGICIAPGARIDDGLLEITVVQHIGLAEVLRNIDRLYWRDIRAHRKVRCWRGAHVRIEGRDVPLELDGEAVGRLPFEAQIQPRALRFLCP